MILLEVVFLTIFWSWAACAVLFLRNTFLPRMPLAATPEQFGLPSQSVQFAATDGVRLDGWRIAEDSDRPWIIVCHGMGTNRGDLLDMAAALHCAGFNLFLFDFRAHGTSAGRQSSFGWREQRDLEGALAYLGRQDDIPARGYGLYAVSMGGVIGLSVAARDDRILAVAADSPYTDLQASIEHHLKLLYRMPRVPFGVFCAWTYRLWFGAWPRQISAVQAAGRLSPRPLLLIAGDIDPRVPLEQTNQILAEARPPKELWLIEGAGHLMGHAMHPQRYVDHVVTWFRSHLMGGSQPA